MPLLDVSDILSDPDFADPTLLCRRPAVPINSHGRAVASAVDDVPFSGVVTQDSGRDLQRNEDGSMISGTITIHTVFRLRDGDLVVWQGMTHTVTNVMDWASYGAGFVCATAMRKPLSS